MKKLTKKQQEMADKAVTILHKLQDLGVEIMVNDGGGASGLTFWRPTNEERQEAYDIVAYTDNEKYDEFKEKNYCPSKSTGLRIDVIIP